MTMAAANTMSEWRVVGKYPFLFLCPLFSTSLSLYVHYLVPLPLCPLFSTPPSLYVHYLVLLYYPLYLVYTINIYYFFINFYVFKSSFYLNIGHVPPNGFHVESGGIWSIPGISWNRILAVLRAKIAISVPVDSGMAQESPEWNCIWN